MSWRSRSALAEAAGAGAACAGAACGADAAAADDPAWADEDVLSEGAVACAGGCAAGFCFDGQPVRTTSAARLPATNNLFNTMSAWNLYCRAGCQECRW